MARCAWRPVQIELRPRRSPSQCCSHTPPRCIRSRAAARPWRGAGSRSPDCGSARSSPRRSRRRRSGRVRSSFGLELDRLEERLVEFLGHGRTDAEDRGERLGLLAAEDFQERLALLGRGALVDDDLGLAMALMDRRPATRTMPAIFSPSSRMSPKWPSSMRIATAARQLPLRGQGVELAGTAPVAVAGGDLRALDAPIDMRHGDPPRLEISHRASATLSGLAGPRHLPIF